MAKHEKQHTGMHPTLEQPRYFPDLYASLCVDIRYWLAPRLPERYTISVERGLSMTDESGATKQYRPDASIDRAESPEAPYADAIVVQPPSFSVEVLGHPQRYVAIRDKDESLVTTIEILSPANKMGDGYEDFRRKQEQLAEKGIHLVEIDLLTQGKRRWRDDRVDQADYVMAVQRAGSSLANVWAAALGEALPAIPVPLLEPDADVPLPLEYILQEYLAKSGLGRRLR
ncbi:DUF4058 family protein [Phaeodactylibacter xiamenensis]|uniref:DUF4058 family protein n=2 Tax=Phaeodactylibacter xiamenensis TaxID=1524460 RepID=UPI000695D3D2|nr:DUF4058 family protein [Phaeodactylibacter xiamenensis]